MTSDNTSTSRPTPVRFVNEEAPSHSDDSVNVADADALRPNTPQSADDARAAEAATDDMSDLIAAPSDAEIFDAAPDTRAASASRLASSLDAAGPTAIELIATRAELRRVESELEKSLSELQSKARELERSEAERRELFDKAVRSQSDFENFRKRTERARTDSYNSLVGDVVGRLLPVVDNLQRALDAQTSTQAASPVGFRDFVQGVELIGSQLADVLQAYGVEPVATVGTPFDPHLHEAIATEATEDFPPDTVTEEIVRGYRLGDKLLRPALVKVAKAE